MFSYNTSFGFEEDWDVTKPRGETREISFDIEEGTWMSVDMSPNGKWLVFDLLGHIYKMDIKGGEAVAITQSSGIAMNYHPRISPDGSEIVFISDRGGQDNLWVMDINGDNPRLIFETMTARFAEPAWSPDGKFIVATQRGETPTGFYRTQDELWVFPNEGGGGKSLVSFGASGEAAPALVGAWAGNDRAQWPSFTPDGTMVYFHSSTFIGAERRLRRVDIKTGRVDSVTETKARYKQCCGRAAYPSHLVETSPEISPDGRYMAYARKLPGGMTKYRDKERNGRTTLWLRDLVTGQDRMIMDPISNTLAEQHDSWHTRVLPGYDWAPDGKSIVISQGGQIRRLWIESGQVETIPFKASVYREISEQALGKEDIGTSFNARNFRWPSKSPSGDKLVFEAVGGIWIKDLSSGDLNLLSPENPDFFYAMPNWSPDGKWVSFISWNGFRGKVWKISVDGGVAIALTDEGIFRTPTWSGDGNSIFMATYPLELNYDNFAPQWAIGQVSSKGGNVVNKTEPQLPSTFSIVNGNYGYSLGSMLFSGTLEGENPKPIARLTGASKALLSPNGKWIGVDRGEDIYVVPFEKSGENSPTIDVWKTGKRVSFRGGYDFYWSEGDVLEFVTPTHFVSFNAQSGQSEKTALSLEVKQDYASGIIALKGGRLITLDDREVIEAGDVLIKDGRIICVGLCDTSKADKTINLDGKTIIPGWVDTHAHHLTYMADEGLDGVIAPKRPTSAAYLAYGVTTTFDPSAQFRSSFAIGELMAAGKMVGPRTYSTGTALVCGKGQPLRAIDSYDEALNQVSRIVDLGAISIKDYKQCTRTQRTWVAEAARNLGVSLTTEGSDLNYFLGLLMTGQAGIEHPIVISPTYSDVAKFFGQAEAHYSGQLILSDYPEGNAIEYWLSRNDLWNDEKLMRWDKWQKLAQRRVYVNKPLNDYTFPTLSETAADIKRAGGYGSIGAHGEQVGLGTHWEAWVYGLSMTPMEMLEAASLDGAHFLGLDHELGSIEVGKLADFMILNSNPLEDMYNTTDIAFVMKGGRLFNGDTLDEVWPRQKAYGARPWVLDDITKTDLRADDYWDKN